MSKILVKCIKRGPDGVDVEKSKVAYEASLLEEFSKTLTLTEQRLKKTYEDNLNSFDTELTQYLAERAEWDSRSKTYIDRAFDHFSGTAKAGCITKPTLINLCVTSMAQDNLIAISDLPHAREMVSVFISDNAGSLYTVEKGVDGGVRRTIPTAIVES